MEIFVREFSVYRERLDELFGDLTEDERDYAEALTNGMVRERFVISRASAREILGQKLDVAPCDVKILFNENGKPYLDGGSVYFSVSHSNDLLVIGVHSAPIGVDVEFMKERNFAALAKEFGFDNKFEAPLCHPHQSFLSDKSLRKDVLAPRGRGKKEVFYRQWTLYEAEVKMVGGTIFGHRKVEANFRNSEIIGDYMVSVVSM